MPLGANLGMTAENKESFWRFGCICVSIMNVVFWGRCKPGVLMLTELVICWMLRTLLRTDSSVITGYTDSLRIRKFLMLLMNFLLSSFLMYGAQVGEERYSGAYRRRAIGNNFSVKLYHQSIRKGGDRQSCRKLFCKPWRNIYCGLEALQNCFKKCIELTITMLNKKNIFNAKFTLLL